MGQREKEVQCWPAGLAASRCSVLADTTPQCWTGTKSSTRLRGRRRRRRVQLPGHEAHDVATTVDWGCGKLTSSSKTERPHWATNTARAAQGHELTLALALLTFSVPLLTSGGWLSSIAMGAMPSWKCSKRGIEGPARAVDCDGAAFSPWERCSKHEL